MLGVFGIDIDPRIWMRRLSVAVTQLVEIVKTTTWGARILLLDEPTSAIPEGEADVYSRSFASSRSAASSCTRRTASPR